MFKVEVNLKEIASKQLTQRAARKEGAPRRPVTTVNCKALHGLQFRAQVEGHSFISDEGDEAGGHDAGPAPLRYFLAGIYDVPSSVVREERRRWPTCSWTIYGRDLRLCRGGRQRRRRGKGSRLRFDPIHGDDPKSQAAPIRFKRSSMPQPGVVRPSSRRREALPSK